MVPVLYEVDADLAANQSGGLVSLDRDLSLQSTSYSLVNAPD
jgi:hypothetical protein